jgi:hypothetical protein
MTALQRSQDGQGWPVCSRFPITLFEHDGRPPSVPECDRSELGPHVLQPLSQRELEVLELISGLLEQADREQAVAVGGRVQLGGGLLC